MSPFGDARSQRVKTAKVAPNHKTGDKKNIL